MSSRMQAWQAARYVHLRAPLEAQRPAYTQLTSREPEQFTDLARGGRTLKSAGVAHGDMVYLLYDFVRQVEPVYKKTPLEARPFGERHPLSGPKAWHPVATRWPFGEQAWHAVANVWGHTLLRVAASGAQSGRLRTRLLQWLCGLAEPGR